MLPTCLLFAMAVHTSSKHQVSLAHDVLHVTMTAICRLQKIRDIAGASGQDDAALDALMRGDFDPEEYDKHMAAAFGDDYYQVPSSDLVLLSCTQMHLPFASISLTPAAYSSVASQQRMLPSQLKPVFSPCLSKAMWLASCH